MNKPTIPTSLPLVHRQRLQRLVEARGTLGAAEALSASRGVVERAAGGLPCRRGSIALLALALAELKDGE